MFGGFGHPSINIRASRFGSDMAGPGEHELHRPAEIFRNSNSASRMLEGLTPGKAWLNRDDSCGRGEGNRMLGCAAAVIARSGVSRMK